MYVGESGGVERLRGWKKAECVGGGDRIGRGRTGERRTLAFLLEGQLALLVVILVFSSSAVLTALWLDVVLACDRIDTSIEDESYCLHHSFFVFCAREGKYS